MNYELKLGLNQRGAVLIFSLIMLLLLTLVSVTMIQQNKQELTMTGNVLDQTKSFASAETELGLAEKVITTVRTTGAPALTPINACNGNTTTQANVSATPFFPTSGTSTGNATITAIYCLIGGTAETPCASGVFNDGSSAACTCAGNRGTEVYAIRWVSTATSNYGSQRILESKYAVNCSGGSF